MIVFTYLEVMQSDISDGSVLLDNAADISNKREHVLSQYQVIKI